MTLLSAIVLLILVMDAVGNVPLFLTALAEVEEKRRLWVLTRELLIALLILILFLLLGPFILEALQINEPSLTVAGGVILFLIALRMIFPTSEGFWKEELSGEPLIVPLAVPLIAGPSALATVLLLVSRQPEKWAQWLAAVVIAWSITAVILLLSAPLGRLFGQRGLLALARLMGMILITIAVQMFLSGLQKFLGE
jgi:MarC family membrane protein